MKSFYKIITLALLMLGLFSVSSNVLAVEPQNSSISSNNNLNTTTNSNTIIMANVGIDNARIISQDKNIFNISFSLSNREIMQSGVRYGVELIKKIGKEIHIVDQVAYEEVLNLAENDVIPINLVYTAPTSLSGEYYIVVLSENDNGFIYSRATIGTPIQLETTGGINILTESCYLSVEGETSNKKYNLTQGVDIKKEENLRLNCQIENKFENTISFVPFFETYRRSIFGTMIEQIGGDKNPIQLKSKEKKEISIILPKAKDPQSYTVKFFLKSDNNKSNSVFAHYVLKGFGATIQYLTLDKDYYDRKEIANIILGWTASADSFPGSRLEWTENQNINLSLLVKNDKGINCGEGINQEIIYSLGSPNQTIPYKINKECSNPKVTAILKDVNGNILDQKDFSFETKSENIKGLSNLVTLLLIFACIFLIILLKRRKKINPLEGNNFIFLFFSMLVLTTFCSVNSVEAAGGTVTLGNETNTFFGYMTVNIDKSIYSSKETIVMDGKLWYPGCINAFVMGKIDANIQGSSGGFWGQYYDYENIIDGTIIATGTTGTAYGMASSDPGYYYITFYGELTGSKEGQYVKNQYTIPYTVPGVSTCGYTYLSCSGNQTGIATPENDTSSTQTWKCPPIDPQETGLFSTSSCSVPKNLSCGDDNTCENGTVVSGSYYLGQCKKTWECTNGTDTISCDIDRQPECPDACNEANINQCSYGTLVSGSSGSSSYGYYWQCELLGCKESPHDPIPTVNCSCAPEGYVYAVDGSCGSVPNTCGGGVEAYNKVEDSDSFDWWCPGLGEGDPKFCTFAKSSTEPWGTIKAEPNPCIIPLGSKTDSCAVKLTWESHNKKSSSSYLLATALKKWKAEFLSSSADGSMDYNITEVNAYGDRKITLYDGPWASENIKLAETVVNVIFEENIPPTDPVITGPNTLAINQKGSFTVVARDPDSASNPTLGHDLYYEIDWGRLDGANHVSDGVADFWIEKNADGTYNYKVSEEIQTFEKSWANIGDQSFWVRAVDYNQGASNWVKKTITILDPNTPTGEITADGCTITVENGTSCKEDYSWKVTNPVPEKWSAFYKATSKLYEGPNILGSGNFDLSLAEGDVTLHLYHNNTDGNGLHVQKIVRAICGSGLTPDASGTKCVKDEPPAPSSGSISVENCYITEIDGTSCVSEEGGEYTVTEVSQGIPILVKQDGVTKVTQWLNAAMGHSYTGTFSPTLKLNPSNFQLTAIGLDNKAIVESTTAQAICGTTSDGITLTANSDNTKCVAGTPPVNEWKIYFDIKPNPLIDGRSAKLTYKIEKTGQGLCTIDSDPKDFSLINLNKWQDPNSKLFVFKVTDDEGEVIIKPRVKTDDDPLNKKTKYTYTGKCTGGYISEPVELDVIKLSEIEN